MHLLNYYFIPFASVLVVSAITISDPETKVKIWSVGVLLLAVVVNWWFANRSYRYMMWMRFLREAQVWLNTLWGIPLFWLLGRFWGPMWLLFVFAPVTAALHLSFRQTLFVSFLNAGIMCGLLRLHGVGFENTQIWGMTLVHAAFIICMGLFVHSLSQVALKLRSGG